MFKFSVFSLLAIIIVIFSPLSYSAVLKDKRFFRRDKTIDPNNCIGQSNSSQRSVSIVIVNQSGYNIVYGGSTLAHGVWQCDPSSLPSLPNGESETFASVSNGFLTGTEGTAFFAINDGKTSTFNIHWDNPFTGHNSYTVSVANSVYKYDVPAGDGNGNNAVYHVTISKNV